MKLLFFMLVFCALWAGAQKGDYFADCLRESSADVCATAAPKLNYEKKYPQALIAAKKACTLEPEFCSSSLYGLATLVGSKEASDIFSFFKSQCAKDTQYCDSYARILEEKKDYPESLNAGRKYYKKFKAGYFPFLAYKHGSKKEAFESSLVQCRNNHSICDFYLRYFPDHPQLSEIADLVKKDCETNVSSSGATSCAIGGMYFYVKNKKPQAYEMWQADCKKNMTSCQLIIAGFKNDLDKIRGVLSQMCEPLNTINGNDKSFQKKHCADAQLKEVSPELQKESDLTSAFYLREQK